MKKILIVSTSDRGGAGNAAFRTYLNLQSQGYDSKMLVFRKTRQDTNVIEFNFRILSLLKKGFRKARYNFRNNSDSKIHKKYCFFNYYERKNYIPTNLLIKFFPFKPDVIILSSITHFINARNIYELWLHFKCKIFWYMMDMAPLTGGCHFAWDCKKYFNHCTQCPALSSNEQFDVASRNFSYKKEYLTKTPITIIASSKESMNQLNNSALFKDCKKEEIMIGLDPELYKPMSKEDAKVFFDIPTDCRVIFAGAPYPAVERKGYTYFINSLKILREKLNNKHVNIVILIAGNVNPTEDLKLSIKSIGYLNEIRLVKAYQCADLFMCSSIEDTGPLMINESILTGTPVVSFNIGGALDLVVTGETGYMAMLKNSEDMANGLLSVLLATDKQQMEFSHKCREKGLANCSINIQVEKFAELF